MKETLNPRHCLSFRRTTSILKPWLVALLFFVSFTSIPVSANLCSKAHDLKAHPESAVEIEITGDVVETLFTTADGTLRPVAGPLGRQSIPEAILQELEKSFPDQDPLEASWDLLSLEEKKDLILFSAQQSRQNFFKNRKVQGLKYRDSIELHFREPTIFLGRKFLAGKYKFRSQEIFGNTAIEFSGPIGMEKNLGLEIHLRTSQTAGQNFQSSVALQKALTNRVSPVHEHIVAEMPLKSMSENPKLTALKMVEFYRRVSWLAQTLRIQKHYEIAVNRVSNEKGSYENMPILTRKSLATFHHYFNKFGNYLQTNSRSPFFQVVGKIRLWMDTDPLIEKFERDQGVLSEKSGLVGIRAGTVYDGSITKWGLEMRDLSPTHDLQVQQDITNAVQARMISQNFGISDDALNQVLLNARQRPLEEILMYPSVSRSELTVADLPASAQKYKVPKLAEISELPTDNEAIGFLFHDWEMDPLVLQFPDSKDQILSSQRMALNYFAHGMSVKESAAWFIRKSALQRLLMKSILPPEPGS